MVWKVLSGTVMLKENARINGVQMPREIKEGIVLLKELREDLDAIRHTVDCRINHLERVLQSRLASQQSPVSTRVLLVRTHSKP